MVMMMRPPWNRWTVASRGVSSWFDLLAQPGLALALRPDKGVYSDAAAYFTAANKEYLTVADNASLSTGDIDFMIGFWMKQADVTAAAGILGKWPGAGNYEYLFNHEGASSLRFYVSNDGTAQVAVLSGNTFSNDTWYFVLGWHDAAANTINIQVNDGTVATAAHTTGVRDGNGALNIGGNLDVPNYKTVALDSGQLRK